jgi:toxin ParE1/3/4
MDYEVAWSPAALEDVECLAEYIAKDSEFYARAVVGRILDVATKLKDFPSGGRVVPELEDETIRERFVYSYRIIYRMGSHEITILAVIHGKRSLDSLDDRIQCS